MNFNSTDILTALQNGENPQNLANSFADALNAAIKLQKEEDEKKKKEEELQKEKEAERLYKNKVDTITPILSDFFDFCEEYYPDIWDNSIRDTIDPKELIKVMDEAQNEVLKIFPTIDFLTKLEPKKTKEIKETKKSEKIFEDPIEKFLKEFGLK